MKKTMFGIKSFVGLIVISSLSFGVEFNQFNDNIKFEAGKIWFGNNYFMKEKDPEFYGQLVSIANQIMSSPVAYGSYGQESRQIPTRWWYVVDVSASNSVITGISVKKKFQEYNYGWYDLTY